MSRTAVVILNYNGQELLRQFLPSVVTHSAGTDIYVADNGSTDDSRTLLSQHFPSVHVIPLDKNYGFCGGYNRALQYVDADYYVLLNSDVAVTSGWLKPMTALLDGDATIGAVHPKIMAQRTPTLFEYAGAGGGYIDALGYPFCRGRIFDTVESDNGQYDDTLPVFWATGACMVIRASLYHQLGGLDEDFFAHMEEIDLCWKLQRAGYRVYYCGSATVHHVGAGTLGYDSPRKTYLNFRNGLTLLAKHLDTGELLVKLPLRISLDILAALVFLLQGKTGNTLAVMRAHWHVVTGLSKTLKKRRDLLRQYPGYSRAAVYPGAVLWAYHARRRKRFTDLQWTPKYGQ